MAGVLGYHGITFRILSIVPFPWFAMSTLTYIPDPALPDLLQGVQQRASALNRSVVLCEADDPRVLRAGVQAQQRGVARITLVGNREAIEQCAAAEGLSLDGLTIRDPANDPETAALADRLFQHRQHKGMTPEKAAAEIRKPLVFANMLVAEGKVDGSVAGAVHTTADVVRTAIQLIGTAPGTSLVSSFFLVALDKPHHPMQGGLIYTDCGLVINPTSEELVDIARAGSRSAQQLLGEEPRVAMLSFSTAGSGGKHPDVEKVQRAVDRHPQAPGFQAERPCQRAGVPQPGCWQHRLQDHRAHRWRHGGGTPAAGSAPSGQRPVAGRRYARYRQRHCGDGAAERLIGRPLSVSARGWPGRTHPLIPPGWCVGGNQGFFLSGPFSVGRGAQAGRV